MRSSSVAEHVVALHQPLEGRLAQLELVSEPECALLVVVYCSSCSVASPTFSLTRRGGRAHEGFCSAGRGSQARARARLRSRPTLREYASSWLPSARDGGQDVVALAAPHAARDARQPGDRPVHVVQALRSQRQAFRDALQVMALEQPAADVGAAHAERAALVVDVSLPRGGRRLILAAAAPAAAAIPSRQAAH